MALKKCRTCCRLLTIFPHLNIDYLGGHKSGHLEELEVIVEDSLCLNLSSDLWRLLDSWCVTSSYIYFMIPTPDQLLMGFTFSRIFHSWGFRSGMSGWFTEWNHLVFQRYIQFKSNYCNVEYSIPPPPTVPEDWGPRGHFHFKPYSGIWQTKKSSVRLGKATQCLRIGVQEDIFVSNHIQAFGKHKNLHLG